MVMDGTVFKYFLPILLLCSYLEATTHISNDTITNDVRQPRVSGRIVKLYSGPRPEPIYCSGEGFQPDPTNCAVFYRCVKSSAQKFTVYRFQCGPGTVYDPETEVCNHPHNTKRSECWDNTPPSPSTEKHQENEIPKEWSRPELPSPISTSKPLYLDQHLGETTPGSTAYPWATSTKRSSSGYPWTSASTPQTSTLIKNPSSKEGNQCTSDGFMGDSENCRTFYRCVGNQRGGFIRYEFSCSETTIWDEDVLSCNHPWAVRKRSCGRTHSEDNNPRKTAMKSSNNDDSSISSTQQQTQISYGSKVSQTQTQISHGSLNQNQTQINYGNSNNKQNQESKQNQTQINYGSAVSQTQTQIDHGNKGVQTQLQIDHSKDASQSQQQEYQTTSKSPTTQEDGDQGYGGQSDTETPSNNSNVNECTESGFTGDENDCKKFYRCVDNGRGGFTKYDFTCGEGTVWDSEIEACNHAWAVKKCGGKAPESSSQNTATNRPTETTTQQQATTTKEEKEDVGYGNQNQQPSQTSTTTRNPVVTENNQNESEQTTTTKRPPSQPEGNECHSSGFMGDKNDCKKFYRCVDNGNGGYTRYEFSCGEGTVWDNQIEACNHAWATEKCGGKAPESSSQNTATNRPTETTTQQQATTTEEEEEDVGYGNQNQQPSQTSTTTRNPVVTENNQNESEQTTTTKRPPSQPEGNECHSSGFMGDKNDCKKFYRCVDNGNGGYTRYEFSCGEGTVWDNQIEACNHAWAVEKCGGQGSSDIQKEPTSSAKPTMSDEYGDTSQTTQTEKEPEEDIDEGYNQPSSSTTSTTQKPSGLNEDICTQEGFVGDPKDCRKFYRCVDNGEGVFMRYEFSCGEGTAWDSEINTCNHEKSVKKPCSNGPSNQNEGTSDSQSTSTTPQPSQTSEMVQTSEQTTQKPPNSKPSEQKECTHEGFVGDDKDCKKFYRCVDNGKGGYIKYDFTCGEGTVWDQEILGCNHENGNKQCKSSEQSQSSSSPEGSTENEVSTTPFTPTENQQTTQKTEYESSPQSSSDQCTSEGFYANPDDCKKFYRCVDNGSGGFTKYDFSCGDGTIWVQEIQACDHDNDLSICSKPTNNSSTAATTTTTTKTQATEEQTGSSESPSFTTTTHSQSQQPNKEDDEYPSETSSESPSSDNKCTSEGFHPDKNDCRRFYRCVDNDNGGYTKYDFSCGEGTAWDSDIQSCNHIREVKSCQDQNTQSNPLQDEDSTQGSSTSSEDGTTTSTSGPSTESSKPASKDSCEQEGYFGNSEDCKKFYRCVDNGKGGFSKYDFDCGEGTIWDQDITACNHPQDVSNPSCTNSDSGTSSTTSSSTASSSTSSSSTTSSSYDQSSSSTMKNNNESSDCSQENSSKKPANKNVNCTEAGYYADPDDCKKFYRCVDWDGDGKRFSVYHFECGEGTIWDPALDTCNHEDSVYPPRDCSGSQSQAESVDEESTTTEGTTAKQDETTTTQSTTEDSTATQTTESSVENTTQQNEQTTKVEQTTEQTTTQQSIENIDQTTEEATTTQQTTEATTAEQTTEATTAQQTTEEQTTTQQSTTEESTTKITEQTTQESTTSQQTTSQESSTTESNDQQSTTEQSTEGTTEPSTIENQTEESQTDGTQTEETQTEESQTEESQTEESQTEHNQTEENQTEESQTEESQTEESQTEESQTEESQTEESQTEEIQTEQSESTTESSSPSEKECPETDDDQNVFVCPTSFKRHPKYCNLFYQCTEDDDTHDASIATFHCPNNTIYDESQVKCVEENKAEKKCNGEIAQKRRFKRLDTTYKEPIVVTDERLKCPTVGHFPFEKYECSAAFLKCQKSKAGKLRGYIYQCPQGFIYWSVSRRCEPKGNVRDCKRSYNNWNGRWEIPIERRNVAP